MIYSAAHRYAFMSIPWTGSTSMREWLRKNYSAQNTQLIHDFVELPESGDWTYFTIVRHPVDRAMSSWRRHHHLVVDGWPETFAEWVTDFYRLSEAFKHAGRLMRAQAEFMFRCPRRLDLVLIKDGIEDQLRRLPFVSDRGSLPEYPHLGKDAARDCPEFSLETLQALEEIFRDDFTIWHRAMSERQGVVMDWREKFH